MNSRSQKKVIISNLQKIKPQQSENINTDHYKNNPEYLFKTLKKTYNDELASYKGMIDKKYSSATNWLSAIRNTNKYDLIMTNEVIINDSLNPSISISIMNGAIVTGFAEPGKALITTAFLKLYPQQYYNKLIRYYTAHELGHSLFFLSHQEGSEKSFMNIKGKTFWQDIDNPKLSDRDKTLIKANLLLRDGNNYVLDKNYQKAIEKYNDALKYDENCFSCYYGLAHAYFQLRDNERGVDYLVLTTQHNSTWSLPYEMLGDWYSKTRQFNIAIEKYKKAIELVPDDVTYRIKLAICYEEKEEKAKAIKEYLSVLKIDPQNVTALQAMERINMSHH